eukprot:12104860-Alexandrium_andersonii.AAC.1
MPNGPDGPLRGCESAKVGDPPAALPGARGAARRAVSPALSSAARRSQTLADSELRRGLFGPLGVLGHRPPIGLDFGPRAHFDQTPKRPA